MTPSLPLSLTRRDPEAKTLRALDRALRRLPPRHRPDEALQVVIDLARALTGATYGALAVTDTNDRTIGFMVSGMDDRALRALKTPPQGHGPLGSLRYDGRPILLDDVSEHRSAFGFPPNHPSMKRLLGVAIWAGGEVRGSLYVTDRRDGKQFDEADEQVLTTLASHASKVIEHDWY
ncbi:MAG: GAF domain-containing protein [Dehalococcoidia bacterium]